MNNKQLSIKCCVAILFLCAFQNIDTKKLCGHYVINNSEFGNEELLLKENGTYTQFVSDCTMDIQADGKWILNKDTVVLNVITRRDLRDKKKNIKMIDGTKRVNKELVRNDSLFYVRDDNSINVDFPLVKQK